MTLDFDTFLVALYTIVDDLYAEHFAQHKPRRPGPKPDLSDSEVLTLVICGQWFGSSENWIVHYARKYWHSYFPRLLCQSATNRRARDLAGVLVLLVPLVGARLGAELATYQILDGVPVPLMRRCRGRRHRLFRDEAAIGRGGSDRDWYYGCQLLLAVTPEGIITGFVLGPADTEGRWLADSMLCWRDDPYGTPWGKEDLPATRHRRNPEYVGPTGPIWPLGGAGAASRVLYIGDGGFSGARWINHWAEDYQALVLTPLSYHGEEAEMAQAEHRRWRHVIETVNGHLESAFHLPFPLAHTLWGLRVRVAAKLVAFNLAIMLNRLFGRPDFAVATIFS